MKIENLIRPTSVSEAYEKITTDKHNALIAGGAWLKLSSRTIHEAIDLTALTELNGIEESQNEIKIGSMTPLYEVERSDIINQYYDGILPKAITQIMGVGLRNLVTIGGNIMSKHGFSDVATPLLALPCELDFYNQGRVSFEAFLNQRPMKKDVLKAVILKKKAGQGYFKKVKKTASDFAILNLAITKDDQGYQVAVGSRPSIATLLPNLKAHLDKIAPNFNDPKALLDIALNEIKLGSNPRASKDYRIQLLKTYLIRGLNALEAQDKEGQS